MNSHRCAFMIDCIIRQTYLVVGKSNSALSSRSHGNARHGELVEKCRNQQAYHEVEITFVRMHKPLRLSFSAVLVPRNTDAQSLQSHRSHGVRKVSGTTKLMFVSGCWVEQKRYSWRI